MRRLFLAIAVALVAVGVMLPGWTSAHSDFSGSEPGSGSAVDGPLRSVSMTFALSVEARPGFELFVDGEAVEAVWTADDEDRTVWVGIPSDPVAAGGVQVTYAVTADDGHLVDGEIAFDVLPIEIPVTTVVATTTTASTATTTVQPVAEVPVPDVVETERSFDFDPLARAVSLLGAVTLLGLILFVAIVLRAGPLGAFVLPVMVSAGMVGLASPIEIMFLADRMGLGVDDVVGDSLARGPLLRAVGALLVLLAGLSLRSGSPAPAIAMAGAAVVLISFAFDGHSVTLGWRPLHGLATVVHVGVAAVWIGSVLGVWLISRSDPGAVSSVLNRLVRLLPVAVGMLALTGVVMTVMIHGWTLNLVDSSWGRILSLKLLLVAAGGALGWAHHRRIQSGRRLHRWTITAEMVLLLSVPVVTAWLVVSMP